MVVNKKIRLTALAAIAGLAFGWLGTATYAQDAARQTVPAGPVTTQAPADPITTQAPAAPDGQLQQRLDSLRANHQQTLTAAQSSRLRQRCVPAQVKIAAYQSVVAGLRANHGKSYETIMTSLKDVITYAGDKSDTQPLQTATDELSSKISEFNTQITAYQQLVDDLAVQNCAADPAAFQANLDAAREARLKLVELRSGISNYMSGNIKPLIESIKIAVNTK